MISTLASLRESALELRDRFVDASRELADASASIERVQSDIADSTATIEALYSDRRSVRREEKYWYTEQISEEKDRRQTLRMELNAQRERRRLATSRIRSVRQEAQGKKALLATEVRRLRSAAAALPTSAKSRFGAQLDGLRQHASTSVEACQQLMAFLTSFDEVLVVGVSPAMLAGCEDDSFDSISSVLGDDGVMGGGLVSLTDVEPAQVETRIEYLQEPPEWLMESWTGLECVDRPNREFLPITGTDETVPYDSYVVADSLDTDGLSMEAIGVAYASALLGAEGRDAILSLGGPGRPDMLSLDRDRNLWITEIKATQQGGRGLHETGLLRSLTDAAGVPLQLFENSAPWLRRSGVEVLRSIEAALTRAASTAEMETLAVLKDRYVEAVRAGFPSEAFKSEVVQVGLISPDADYLLPLTVANSGVIDRFVDDVRPDRIAQVNVVEGAHEASVAEHAGDATRSVSSEQHSNQGDHVASEAGTGEASETDGSDGGDAGDD